MPDKPLKTPPPYAIASVDHALRLAAMLQLEGGLTVSEVAGRLGVARSTAHRLLAMLVYRDFAVQDENRLYPSAYSERYFPTVPGPLPLQHCLREGTVSWAATARPDCPQDR